MTPTTRDVPDTALMLQAMAGAHASDPWSVGTEVPPYLAQPLRGPRVGVCASLPGRPLAADVRAEFERALATLESLGAQLQPFDGADFLFTPTLTRTALPNDQDLFGTLEIDGQRHSEVRPTGSPGPCPSSFNLTGHPAISLPSGLQLVGRFKQNLPLLQAATPFLAAHTPSRSLPLIAD